jgi:hypothetical protein
MGCGSEFGEGQVIMSGNEIDMRTFARNAGANVNYPAGSIVFKGDPGPCMCNIGIDDPEVFEMCIASVLVRHMWGHRWAFSLSGVVCTRRPVYPNPAHFRLTSNARGCAVK